MAELHMSQKQRNRSVVSEPTTHSHFVYIWADVLYRYLQEDRFTISRVSHGLAWHPKIATVDTILRSISNKVYEKVLLPRIDMEKEFIDPFEINLLSRIHFSIDTSVPQCQPDSCHSKTLHVSTMSNITVHRRAYIFQGIKFQKKIIISVLNFGLFTLLYKGLHFMPPRGII